MIQANLRPKAAIVSKKINNFHFFPYKSLCDQIWPWRKMGQSQPRVIIWTTLVVLPYTMLHTKFQGHWSTGSGEEDFLRFFTIYGHCAMLVMWPRPSFLKALEALYEIYCNRPCSLRAEVVWNCGWTTEPAYTISSPGAFGSGELKSNSLGCVSC